ncbi:outer membrane beta-barrel protein [Vibrio sp. FNV 38]|nr:outer membrane beta-barrel protein [Vibrio sp. FNV 38]
MKKALLALVLMGASATAAADSWIYGGASVGQSDLKGSTDTAFSVHAGTGILPFIGIELGYANHGSFEVSQEKFDVESIYFAAKPSINFGPLQVYGKAGAHSWSASGDYKKDSYDIMYGVGADYQVFGPLSVGAEYMVYSINKGDVGTFAVTAALNFL